MRVVIQRVSRAQVAIGNNIIGKIGKGLVILLGVTDTDTEEDARFLAEKSANLRIFNDEQGKMNLSALDVGGEILSVSQFTLYGDCRKGRRPSFVKAAHPDLGEQLYDSFNAYLRESGLKIETGEFGGMMDVDIYNEGPVTIIIDSKKNN